MFLSLNRSHQIVTANTLMLLAAEHDAELSRILEEASLVVPESRGVFWAGQQLGTPFDELIPGIDLLQRLCRLAAEEGHSIYLLGAKPGVADKAAAELQGLHPGLCVVGTHHGYFINPDEETVAIDSIHQAAPVMLFVARSVPEQEKWIHRHLEALGARVVIGVGGSFDVLSGGLRRAPAWMRELGLEWLYRTLQEPWRIRRIAQLPVFVWKILRQ
jgi:N-acetylglucosaminyldiphosphoundecaprenol N-acetyl-beta-D-mannosaminyltransferase